MDLEWHAVWQHDADNGSWNLIVHDGRIIWDHGSDINSNDHLYIWMSQKKNRNSSFNNLYKIKIEVDSINRNEWNLLYALVYILSTYS